MTNSVSRNFEFNIGNNSIKIETGKLAKQANGSILITCGETVLLVTAVASKEPREGIDFFPLLVDYEEKFYAAGKIPGGFFKREGKPSDNAILTSRLIDRPLRPLFPEGYYNDVQIIASVLSYDQTNLPDTLAIIGASCALYVSDIPFNKPVAAVRIGYLDGEYILNPTVDILKNCQLNLIIAGTKDSVIMIEGEVKELPEELVLNALEIAQKEINIIVDAQIKFSEELNNQQPSKTAWMENKEALQNKEGYYKYLEEKHFNDIEKALLVFDKKEREKELDILFNDIVIKFKEVNEVNEEDNFSGFLFKEAYDLLCKNIIRKLILDKGIRLDHRSVDEIRNIESEISILPRVHGSALFTRGQTQALVITTLGSVRDQQSIDTLEEDTSRKFYLHYNFPPFSVGDVKPRRSQSRREIGHGALAEKAIRAVIPNESDFPYTIRVVSEVLESNGSSSMATVCGTSLSLMDAGVPITKPVAGIALGLVKEGEQYKILTDIMGLEDHYGDMDFKAAGTVDGLTAIQMDLKIDGISINVIRDILEKSKIGRMFILEKMNSTIDKPKEELSHYVPKMFIMKVNVDKIGSIIGPSGRNIKKIIEESCTEIDIKDNGEIFITADTTDKIEKAKNLIEGLVREVKTGEIYNGKVKRITKYGAFVEILPGVEGLLHISNLCHYRVDKVEDIIKLDDEFPVKVIGIDQQGKIDLSKKELTPRPDRNANVDGSQNRRPNKRNYDK